MATAMLTFLVQTFVEYDNTDEDDLEEKIHRLSDDLGNSGFQNINLESVEPMDER